MKRYDECFELDDFYIGEKEDGRYYLVTDVERTMIPRPDAEEARKALTPLNELIKIGKEGMEPDYTRWLTFHDRVVELASEARTALLRHMGVE